MIEVVIDDRCGGCGSCVDVCPSDVLERAASGKAVIARQADCQTCYLCELYCPEDALFVWPQTDHIAGITADQALATGDVGGFRRDSGWDEHAGAHTNQHWRMGAIFERARLMAIDDAAAKAARTDDGRTK